MTLKVEAIKIGQYNTERFTCVHLGHGHYQCGACKKGYFKITSNDDRPEKCPNCKATIIIDQILDNGRML